MPESVCVKEEELGKLKAKADMAETHISESNRQGGYRDRLLIAEQVLASSKMAMEKELAEIKRIVKFSNIRVGLVAGLIGGLTGQITPQLFQWIIRLLLGR